MEGAFFAEQGPQLVLCERIVFAKDLVHRGAKVLDNDALTAVVAELDVIDPHHEIGWFAGLSGLHFCHHGLRERDHGGRRRTAGHELMGCRSACHLRCFPKDWLAIAGLRKEPAQRAMERGSLHVTSHDELDPEHD